VGSYRVIARLDVLWAEFRQRCHRGELVGQIAL
jgi:hypothetical protein